MKKVEGCGSDALMVTLYTTTVKGSLLPAVTGFTNVPCGFQPLRDESGTHAVLPCEFCAAKNGYTKATHYVCKCGMTLSQKRWPGGSRGTPGQSMG